MNAGTNRRTRGETVWQRDSLVELRQPTIRDCRYSRRNTVMLALHRPADVIREYQSDSLSKRPASSVSFGPPGTGPPEGNPRKLSLKT